MRCLVIFKRRGEDVSSLTYCRPEPSGGPKNTISSTSKKMDWGAAAVRPSAWKKCLSLLLAFGFSNSLSAAAATGSQSVGNGPDVIELFTSEGCSSCPPADSLLSQLAASRKGSILALSEHVDYWDYLGWKDPNSSALFTARQQAYARRMRLSSTYTPQVIVNGILETIGNRRDAVEGALKTAEKPKLIKVTCRISSDSRTLTIEAKSTTPIANDLLANFAVTTDGVLSKVTRGENSGRELRHDNVVRRMATKRVGSGGEAIYKVSCSLPLENIDLNDSQAVVFLQESGPGRVVASGSCSLAGLSQ